MRDKNYFKTSISINDILKNDIEQINLLGKLIMVLVTISSNFDYYFNKISNLRDSTNEAYMSIIDELLKTDKTDKSFNASRISDVNMSYAQKSFINNDNMKLTKKLEEYEKDQKKYIFEKEREISELKGKNNEINKKFSELEIKYKDCFRELDSLKANLSLQSMNMQESLKVNDLELKLTQKENEYDDLKKDKELLEKHLVSENNKLKEKNNLLQDKVIELKNISNDNEKLKTKIKELLQFKEKCIDYDNLVIYLEQRNKQIENMNLEKKKFVENIEKLQRDIKEEKEKFRQVEFEKKKIEFEFNDIKNNMSRIETQLKKKG